MWTQTEAAIYLVMSDTYIRNLAKSGEVPCVQTDRKQMFDVSDLNAWIAKKKKRTPELKKPIVFEEDSITPKVMAKNDNLDVATSDIHLIDLRNRIEQSAAGRKALKTAVTQLNEPDCLRDFIENFRKSLDMKTRGEL